VAQPRPLRYLEARPPTGTRELGTLLLLHAFPLNARMWEPQFTIANSGWRVIAPHLRGMDGGDGEIPPTSIDDAAGAVVDLLDHLHIESAVVGGVSMGGYLAFALYRWAARYFQALVLADTRAEPDSSEALEGRQKMLALLRTSGPAAVADQMIPKLLGETTRRTRPDLVDRVRALVQSNSAEAIAGALKTIMTRPDSRPILSTIGCPTLVIVGEEDTLTPPSMSRDMHRSIRGSSTVTIPAAGHLASLEQSEAFNRALEHFLGRLA
jgi:3-oxoadipate enol-lactonase